MKTRINLYRDEFKPKFVWLSVTNMLILSVVVLLVLAGIYYSAWALKESRQSSLSELNASMKERQERLDTLTLQLTQRTKNPILLGQLQQRQVVLASSTRLAQKLDVLEQNQNRSYSMAFESLSNANSSDVWLTHFYLSSEGQIIEGKLMKAEALPAWLQRLGKTPYFVNSDFEAAAISTEEEQLSFVLRNGDTQTQSKGSR